jgi:hypothetical protein
LARNPALFVADDTGNAVYVGRVDGDLLAARDLFFCVSLGRVMPQHWRLDEVVPPRPRPATPPPWTYMGHNPLDKRDQSGVALKQIRRPRYETIESGMTR